MYPNTSYTALQLPDFVRESLTKRLTPIENWQGDPFPEWITDEIAREKAINDAVDSFVKGIQTGLPEGATLIDHQADKIIFAISDAQLAAAKQGKEWDKTISLNDKLMSVSEAIKEESSQNHNTGKMGTRDTILTVAGTLAAGAATVGAAFHKKRDEQGQPAKRGFGGWVFKGAVVTLCAVVTGLGVKALIQHENPISMTVEDGKKVWGAFTGMVQSRRGGGPLPGAQIG